MIILTIRTDQPEAEVALFDDAQQLAAKVWQAHRALGVTIHQTIKQLLDDSHLGWGDIAGIVAFAGPGSFTGLRIGLTVANALAYANNLPVVASRGEQWRTDGIGRLQKGESDHQALPEYGAEATITQPRK
jgi:tRNA threonylcarbamoyladenosine biosynthesis protein TsaB